MRELRFVGGEKTPAESEIRALEERIGATFPADYRRYLMQHNGAAPLLSDDKCTFVPVTWNGKTAAQAGRAALIQDFYPIQTWLDKYETFKPRIPDDAVTIGCDPGGSQFLIAVKGAARGQVSFWHRRFALTEEEEEDGLLPGYENVGAVASSFDEFLEKLELEPDDWDEWEAANPESEP